MMNHPTKESSEQKNVSSLGNFGRKWLFLGIVLWLVLGVGSTLAVREIYGHEMSKVSEAYMKLARAPLLLHDYRTAMIQLSSAVEGGFRQVSFKDMDGNFVFKVPYREEKGFFDQAIDYGIELSGSEGTSASTKMNLIFIYSTTELILLTLLAWAVVAAANVPILIYIGNRLGKFHKTREKERALAKMMVFAKRAAHDLRSPLSALKAVRILIEKEPERAAKLLEQSMSRVDLIAEDLLVQSRVDLDGIRVLGKEAAKESAQREESFKLSLAMKEIVDEKKLSVSESSHVRISFFDEAEEALLAVERATFQRVLSNIIQNSLEAVDKNGFISISTGVETNFVCIEVRDNGKGIPEEVVRRLNENPHSFNKPNGNGLGLSSAKEFAEFYGGSLLIDSKVNGGTLVVLRLPIRHRPK